MIFGSVCSGIEAASVAWNPLGWQAAFFAEKDKFPSAVLAHHYPDVPNYGDMTNFKEWPNAKLDVLVGGTPCQSFSIAGLRKGLDDPRGNLMLTFGATAAKYRSTWLVWENVFGILSINGGKDFASFLGLITGQLIAVPKSGWGNSGIIPGYKNAYGIAYRVLDAQFVGVPQRRRRVFVVGYLGDWRRAAAVLFERHSLSGNTPPSREKGKVAPTIPSRSTAGGGLGTDFDCDGGLIASTGDISHCLNAGGMGRQDYETETLITHSLRGEGFDASEDGTGRGTPLVPVPIQNATRGKDKNGLGIGGNVMFTLDRASQHAVAYDMRGRDGGAQLEGPHDTANIRAADGGSSRSYISSQMRVRRLTPKECARLQGFPDNYLDITFNGKPACDGPKYKALGNSMAIPCMSWIGSRIDAVHQIASIQKQVAA